MKLNRVTLKSYFERGDVPTQQEFAHLIDSIPNFIEDKPVLKINNTAPDEFGNINIEIPQAQPLQYDAQPTQASTKLVNSGSLYTTLQNYFTSTQVDNAPVQNSTKLVLSGALFTELAKKVNTSAITESITQGSGKIPTAGAVYAALEGKVEVDEATQKLNPALIPDQDFTQYGPATDIADSDTGVLQDIEGNKKRYSISGLLARLTELLANSFIKPISGGAQTIRQTEGSLFEIVSEQADTEGNITASTSLTVGPDGAKVGGQRIVTADELTVDVAIIDKPAYTVEAPELDTDVLLTQNPDTGEFKKWTLTRLYTWIKEKLTADGFGAGGSGGGSVDTVNNVAPDAGTKNITLTTANITEAVSAPYYTPERALLKADQAKMGALENLETIDKSTVVAAVNEVKLKTGALDNDQKTLKIFKHTNYNGF